MMEAKKIKPYSNIQIPQGQIDNRQTNIPIGNPAQFPLQYSQGNQGTGIPVNVNDPRFQQFITADQQNINQPVYSNQGQLDQNMKLMNKNQQLYGKTAQIYDDANIKGQNNYTNNMLNIDQNNEISKRPLTPNRMQRNIFVFQEGIACQNPNIIQSNQNNNPNYNFYPKKYPSIIIHNANKQIFELSKGMSYDQLYEKAFGPSFLPKNKQYKNKDNQVMINSKIIFPLQIK